MNSKTVLVTGGAGFIGSNVVEGLLSQKDLKISKIYIIDDLSTGKEDNIPKSSKIRFIKGDISNNNIIDDLFNKEKINYVFHKGAIASVKKSIDNPISTNKVNFLSTLYLLEKSRQNYIDKFIFASSAAVYGKNEDILLNEKSFIEPLSPYGIDKYASERYVLQYYNIYGMPTTAFRYFNVYGPKQDSKSEYSGVISIFFDAFYNSDNPKIKIYGDGNQTRDFIYIKDIVDFNILTLTEDSTDGEVFNLGTGKNYSLLELINVLENIFNKKAQINFFDERIGDIKHSMSDIEKAQQFNWQPQFDLHSGLTEMYKY